MALSLLGSANLVVSQASPEWTFEHCVSPSPRGDRSDRLMHHRKSQEATVPLLLK